MKQCRRGAPRRCRAAAADHDAGHIINGRNEPVVPVANAEFLDERLPISRLAIIDAGHFVWEEAPAEYASIIIESIASTGPV